MTVTLLAGLWLPATARPEGVDADGICGPSLPAPRSAPHVESDHAVVLDTTHCLFCHLRHDMAGAFVPSVPQIMSPVGAGHVLSARLIGRDGLVLYGDAAPRGPPDRS